MPLLLLWRSRSREFCCRDWQLSCLVCFHCQITAFPSDGSELISWTLLVPVIPASGNYLSINGTPALRSFIYVDVGEPTPHPCSMTGMIQTTNYYNFETWSHLGHLFAGFAMDIVKKYWAAWGFFFWKRSVSPSSLGVFLCCFGFVFGWVCFVLNLEDTWILLSPILQYVGIANQRQNVLMTVRASSVHGMSSNINWFLPLLHPSLSHGRLMWMRPLTLRSTVAWVAWIVNMLGQQLSFFHRGSQQEDAHRRHKCPRHRALSFKSWNCWLC